MTIINSPLYNKVNYTYNLSIGVIYFFDKFIVVEFSEGMNLTFESLNDFFSVIKKHFGTDIPFGIIANRFNSYSQALIDAKRFEDELKNIVAIAVITYSNTAKKSLEYENYFFKTNRKQFDDIMAAEKWIKTKVNDVK